MHMCHGAFLKKLAMFPAAAGAVFAFFVGVLVSDAGAAGDL